MNGEPMVTAIDLPPRRIRARKHRAAARGDAMALVGGALVSALGTAVVWLVRRVHIAVPVAITLTVAPLADVHEVASESPELASAGTARVEPPPPRSTAQSTDRGLGDDVVVRMSPRPTATSKAPAFKPAPVQKPTSVPAPPRPVLAPPTPDELGRLYMKVGKALKAAAQFDPAATRELWSRYRWIQFNDAIQSANKRATAAALLDKLLVDATALST